MNSRQLLFALIAGIAGLPASTAFSAESPASGWPWIGKNADVWEVRFGGAAYDTGVLTKRDENGFVLSGDILMPSPGFLSVIGSPRPYIGGSIAFVENGAQGVNFAYAGLNWQAHWTETFYTSASIGGSINSADFSNASPNHWGLGCNLLFHLGVSAGFDMSERVSVEAYADHFSNGNLCFSNGGMESAGMRVGLKF